MNAGREYSTAAVMFHSAIGERFGLSVTDLKTLDLLQRLGPLAAGEIATHTGLATASVTSLIDRLERKRLVRRLRDRADRRRVIVSLTPSVGKTIVPLFESLSRRMLARFRSYSDDEIASIREFLTSGAHEMRDEAAKLAATGST
jgi:DNA-binding MarR family transcriptional regulator